MFELTENQRIRYDRNILIKEIGEKGQIKLLDSKVLIIGLGGLGSPAALYLAASGIGTIGIADFDAVDISNLQRQILHTTKDIKKLKINSADLKLNNLNPEIKINKYKVRITIDFLNNIINDYDFVLDCTDNFKTKFLINDVCVKKSKAFSHAGVLGMHGQSFTYVPGTFCYRCLFPSLPGEEEVSNCSQKGVLGSLAGIIGSVQACETIKYLTGIGELLTNKLLKVDVLNMRFSTINYKKNDTCPICSGID